MTDADRKKFKDAYDDASPEAQEKVQAIFREYNITYRDLSEAEAEESGKKIADILNLDKASRTGRKRSLTSMLRLLRENGWRVAAHSDRCLETDPTKFRTLWLFTDTRGNRLTGDAETDEDAVAQAYLKVFKS